MTETILDAFEAVLDEDRDHLLANHLSIHAVEARHPAKSSCHTTRVGIQ